jgi:Holliday junction resolvase RusA-like endonuclease
MGKREIRFVVKGKPWVQKNNLHIRKKKVRGKLVPFVGHSDKLKSIRDQIGIEMYAQYQKQGLTKPIDYPIEVEFTFYCKRQWEPDLDNLPQIWLDAAQGVKVKGGLKIAITLADDKLVRKETSEKIVEGDPRYDGEQRTEIIIREYTF